MSYYFWRYFWWVRYPSYWWKLYCYDHEREVPFVPNKMNYVQGFKDNPRVYFRVYYQGPEPPTEHIFGLDRVWCSKIPPMTPSRPMAKGTIGYAHI